VFCVATVICKVSYLMMQDMFVVNISSFRLLSWVIFSQTYIAGTGIHRWAWRISRSAQMEPPCSILLTPTSDLPTLTSRWPPAHILYFPLLSQLRSARWICPTNQDFYSSATTCSRETVCHTSSEYVFHQYGIGTSIQWFLFTRRDDSSIQWSSFFGFCCFSLLEIIID